MQSFCGFVLVVIICIVIGVLGGCAVGVAQHPREMFGSFNAGTVGGAVGLVAGIAICVLMFRSGGDGIR